MEQVGKLAPTQRVSLSETVVRLLLLRNRHTKKNRSSRRRTRYAHGAVGPPGDPFGPQWLSQWVSSRDVWAHRGFRQRPYRAHAVTAGGCALFLLKPRQEGRVEGVGPVQVAVGGHRVEATEQGRADGHVYRTRFPGHTFVLCRLA